MVFDDKQQQINGAHYWAISLLGTLTIVSGMILANPSIWLEMSGGFFCAVVFLYCLMIMSLLVYDKTKISKGE